jgi:hypothetical protein
MDSEREAELWRSKERCRQLAHIIRMVKVWKESNDAQAREFDVDIEVQGEWAPILGACGELDAILAEAGV